MERQLYWNISHVWIMYAAFGVAVLFFAHGLRRRVRYWRFGQADREHLGALGRRIALALKDALLQQRVFQNRFAALFHGLLFYGFLVLVLTTTVVFLSADLGLPLFKGWTYLVLSLGSDLAGVLVLVGLALAGWRRYLRRAPNLDRGVDDGLVLGLLAAIVLSGFAVEALRIRFAGEARPAFSPVGAALALPLARLGEAAGLDLHRALWWLHLALAMAFIALIPSTKLFHLLTLPLNALFHDVAGSGAPRRPDLEALMSAADFDPASFSLGIGAAGDFTWKQRFDHDACVGCGRCQDACPASRCGDEFGPKDFILSLKRHGHLQVEQLARQALATSSGGGATAAPALVENVFHERYVWHCRTCRACVEACPARIDHVTPFVEIRRNEVLMKGRLPDEAQRALRQLETHGTAFGPQEERRAFFEAAGFRTVQPGEEVEALYFVGCLSSFDQTKQRIARDFVRLLERAGVRYGTLGADETCCGDPARVLGNELLFQSVAKAQIAALRSRKFKYLVANCPHCLHVLATEYRSLGADFEVIHHSVLIQRLIAEGRLQPTVSNPTAAVFHDPCYLGRYQGQFDAPRRVLEQLPGTTLDEMTDRREKSMCCGAGGGHFFMDLKAPRRINNLRLEQARAAGASTVAVGCPFCMGMFTDAVSMLDLGGTMEVADLATLTLRSLEPAALPASGPPACPGGCQVQVTPPPAVEAEASP
jgi:Fe-S oxidoreductase/nitrate reductase gamma subunit